MERVDTSDFRRLAAVLICLPVMIVSYYTAPARAADLASPEGEVILEVTGAIRNHNMGQAAVFDIKMLESLMASTIETETPWTDGMQTFVGVPIHALLEAVDADGTVISFTAINDYVIDIPMEDIKQQGVILAYKNNEQYMRVRDKGPLWVIYPWTSNPELNTELYLARSIWQVRSMHVK